MQATKMDVLKKDPDLQQGAWTHRRQRQATKKLEKMMKTRHVIKRTGCDPN